ncbi:EDS1-like protein, partial [Drosera capensis]
DAEEHLVETDISESDTTDRPQRNTGNAVRPIEVKPKQRRRKMKPAAHRGFMARAKGIPALELYRLAQKKRRKLVLCGHSLGGAVAALSTLSILRVIAESLPSKESEKVDVKCITFSQPPVGNAALRDYVNKKGWQHYFKTYCIPEDLVPRILSPAYFHHYNAQTTSSVVNGETAALSLPRQGEQGKSKTGKQKDNGGERLVLGVGPVQTSFWRLSRLVPLDAVRRHLSNFGGNRAFNEQSTGANPVTTLVDDDVPESLEIQEGSDGVSLKPLPGSDKKASEADAMAKFFGKRSGNSEDNVAWRGVPYLPSYVPFGQVNRELMHIVELVLMAFLLV